MTTDVEEIILKHTFYNALRHSGKASVNAVLGKVLSEKPDLRSKTKEITSKVKLVVAEVNKLSQEKIEKEIIKRWPQLIQIKKEKAEKGLPELPNIKKYDMIVTRFSPNPDCVLHIGSIRAIVLSYDYAKKYEGKFILRFEDTDPRLKKSALEFYDSIKDDLKWLNCIWDEEYIQSDRLLIYYDYAQQLIKSNGAYVCTCNREEFREKAYKRIECPCRALPIGEQMRRWTNMLDGSYNEGEAVLRVKTDLDHKNPAVRDWPAFRIIDPMKYPHPRIGSKFRVWPLYNYASGVDDHLQNISHIIRGKEHITNTLRQTFLYKHLGWDYPETIHYGRLKIVGADLSKSKIIKAVESGKVSGFDDPRLATIKALRRRGFAPECFKLMIMNVGVKPVEATLSWENINALNRKILDSSSNRYFFIENPVEIIINNVTMPFKVKLLYHPDYPTKGYRTINIISVNEVIKLYVSSSDVKSFRANQIVRLMELFNIKIKKVSDNLIAEYYNESLEDARKLKAPIIQWVKQTDNIKTQIVMPDASTSIGLSEFSLINEGIGAKVQFIRFGFARMDEKSSNGVKMYFAHS